MRQNAEKLTDLVSYLCKFKAVLRTISPEFENLRSELKKINVVFENQMHDGFLKRYYDYENSQSNLLQEIEAEPKMMERLHEIVKVVKDDYEVLRGPTRIYLKLKGVYNDDESKDSQIMEKDGEYRIKLEPLCEELLSKDNPFRNYIDPKKPDDGKGPFSYVYNYGVGKKDPQNAKFMFNNSMKETIDNMIGSTNQVIMAYGPSGSGKTYNLIGENFSDPKKGKTDGVIKYALGHILDKSGIKEVHVSSYQYYSTCSQGKSDVEMFDSFSSNISGVNNSYVYEIIDNKKIDASNFVDISCILLVHPLSLLLSICICSAA